MFKVYLFSFCVAIFIRLPQIFNRKAGRDRALKDFRALNRRLKAHPQIKLDHIVKERYPTFIDAIKDLDDCLTLLFLFSTFPSLKYVPREQSALCRRLTIEFLHAVIASKSLCYCFISIKGYYFQAEIKGQKVTWMVPHYYPFQPQSRSEVDFRMMSIFVEFYTIMLGFVNFRLYNQLNLVYPPQFPTNLFQDTEESLRDEQTFVSERIAALNVDLLKIDPTADELEADDDMNIDLLEGENESEQIKHMKEKAAEERKLRNLFKGLKIFINREVPREPLVFLIRCLGGKVSWDKTLFVGATFDETDESITHQIVDRPSVGKQYMSRDYVQPQWVFDCVNQRQLLPTNKYFIGAILPPHLSPFVDPSREDVYIPPEEKALHDPSAIETHQQSSDDEENEQEDENMPEPERDNLLENAYRQEKEDADSDEQNESDDDDDGDNVAYKNDSDLDDETNEQDAEKRSKQNEAKKKMAVQSGKVHRESARAIKKQEIEEHRLKARMVKPRHRKLFKKLINEKQEKQKENWLLEKKRKRIDAATKEEKKQKKLENRKKLMAQ